MTEAERRAAWEAAVTEALTELMGELFLRGGSIPGRVHEAVTNVQTIHETEPEVEVAGV